MIETEVDAKRRLAIHTNLGKFSLIDVQSAMQRFFVHAEFEADFSIIWDLRDSDIDIILADILSLDPEIVNLSNQLRPGGKTAWIAATAFGESILKLLYNQHDWHAEWRTFSKYEAALAWCQAKEKR